jgi:hypothetical protein
MKDLPINAPLPVNLLAAAFQYSRDMAKVENHKGRLDGIKFSEKTGRPLPVDEESVREMKLLWITQEDGLKSSKRKVLPKVQVVKPMSETKKEVEEEALRRDWVKRAFQHGWESELGLFGFSN